MMNAAENKEALETTETATAPTKAKAALGKHLILTPAVGSLSGRSFRRLLGLWPNNFNLSHLTV